MRGEQCVIHEDTGRHDAGGRENKKASQKFEFQHRFTGMDTYTDDTHSRRVRMWRTCAAGKAVAAVANGSLFRSGGVSNGHLDRCKCFFFARTSNG